jgi:hypothetical protein
VSRKIDESTVLWLAAAPDLRPEKEHAEPNGQHSHIRWVHVKPPASRGPPLAGQFRVAGPDAWYPGGQVSVQDDPAWRAAQAAASTSGWTLLTVHVAGGSTVKRWCRP